jgi:2-polyprenyl-3-methyl-5-hydroxy-6-metoxy-1,4-benzoquinol methylase
MKTKLTMHDDNSAYGKNKDSIIYWEGNRNQVDDLYPSEKHFFLPTIKKSLSVLDVGCAAGGFADIVYEINPEASYTGIDVSANLIKSAKKRHPEAYFYLYDGVTFPDKLGLFDLVYSFGVLHHVDDWHGIVKQMLSFTKKHVLFDLRLTSDSTINNIMKSYQKICFNGEWDGKTIISYNINNIGEVIQKLMLITDKDDKIDIYGYLAPPTKLAVTTQETVTMASIYIEKEALSPGFYCNIKY